MAERPETVKEQDQSETIKDSEKTAELLQSTESFLKDLEEKPSNAVNAITKVEVVDNPSEVDTGQDYKQPELQEGVSSAKAIAEDDVVALLSKLSIGAEDEPVENKPALVQSQLTPLPSVNVAEALEDKDNPENTDTAKVQQHVLAWAKAWSSKDLEAYYQSYSRNFSSRKYRTHAHWKRERAKRIQKANSINVRVESLKVTMTSHVTAKATFKQIYKSHNYSDAIEKNFRLIKTDGAWKISDEYSRPL